MAEPGIDNGESPLAYALKYAQLGLRVLPIKPGTKRPPMNSWVEAATSDEALIRNWFDDGLYRDHGIGLAMGVQPDGSFIFAVDVDEYDPAHSGGETLADSQTKYGELPDTWCSITGSGGMHLLFSAPPGMVVRNGTAGSGLDIRGAGGQIVVCPSIHPTTNTRYEWEHGYAPGDMEIAVAPDWLLTLVADSVTPKPAPLPAAPVSTVGTISDPDSPAEWLRANWNWPVQLADAGWEEHHTDRQTGDVHWTRPGKDRREGASAILHMPDGPLVVFSTDASMTGLRSVARHVNRDGSVSVTPLEFYASLRHGGDVRSAARTIGTMMTPATTTATRLSAPIQLGASAGLLGQFPAGDGADPIDDLLTQRISWPSFWTDTVAGADWVAEPVLPKGRMTVFYAPAKQGKSEVALAAALAVATGGPIFGQRNDAGPRDVLYLDYEMTPADLFDRLEQFGADDTTDLSHLHYFSVPSMPPLDTPRGAGTVAELAKRVGAELVVIDTLGRAVEGEENDNDTYRDFARLTGNALKAIGVTVLRTDHAGKEAERGQRGASAKNDDADVVFRVERRDPDGWQLKRTHTRINWVPETVEIERIDNGDGTLDVRLPVGAAVSYTAGTLDYVRRLRAAGIALSATTTVHELRAAVAKLNDPALRRRGRHLSDAIKCIHAQESGPSQVTPGNRPTGSPRSDETGSGGQQEPSIADRPGDGESEANPDRRLSAGPSLGDVL
jgi:hypothetical protein